MCHTKKKDDLSKKKKKKMRRNKINYINKNKEPLCS